MPSSRKRAKGKLRKAKSNARSVCVDKSTWRNWALWGERMKGIQCSHGAVIPPSNKDIDLFMSELVDSMSNPNLWKEFEALNFMRDTITRHPVVWNNNDQRNLTINLLSAMGANDILRASNDKNKAIYATKIVPTILLLEHYGESNDVNAAFYCTYSKVRDIDGGKERETLRFFSKRISCTCLDSLYAQVKSKQSKVGKCYACVTTFKRSALRVCERCRISQYCSEDCQRQQWPLHKRDCDSWSHYRAWCIEYGFILE